MFPHSHKENLFLIHQMLQHGKNSFLVAVTFSFIKDPSKPSGAGGGGGAEWSLGPPKFFVDVPFFHKSP